MSPKVQLAISFVQANGHRALRSAEIAQSVELSSSRLFDLFKAELGVSPFQYQKRARLERARQLLERTLSNIKVIAADVGYSDGSHFMRDFKEAYGRTPTKYRVVYLSRRTSERSDDEGTVSLASKQ